MQKRVRDRVTLKASAVSKTQQHMKDRCDINKIMSSYQKTGLVTHVNRHKGRYADVSAVGSYDEAFALVKEAEISFLELPAGLRQQFGNSPAAFFDFVSNPENIPLMREMGLIPKETPEPGTIPPAQQEAAPAASAPADAGAQGKGA